MKMIGMLLGLALLAQVVGAYEVEGNPDRKISIGLNYERDSVSGDYNSTIFKLSDAGELTFNRIKADLRLPIASFLTFSIGGGYSMEKMRISFIKDDHYDMTGYNLTAGIRVYIP